MSNLTREKQRKHYLVFGYVREVSVDIPNDVVDLIFIFYLFVKDQWNVELSHKDSIKNYIFKHPGGGANWINAFGTHEITKGEIKTWKFQINFAPIINEASVRFGIIDVNELSNKLSEMKGHGAFDRCCEAAYAISSIGGYFWQFVVANDGKKERRNSAYCGKILNETIINMTLNLDDESSLSFIVNDKDYGNAVTNVDLNKSWCLGISMLWENESVEILS